MAQQTDDLVAAERAADNPHTPFHVPADELAARLDDVWASPSDEGRVELIVRRPAAGEREVLAEASGAEVRLVSGVSGKGVTELLREAYAMVRERRSAVAQADPEDEANTGWIP